MTSPEALELEAVDAALAGREVAPEHAELAELALLLRDDRVEPNPAWAAQLDRRAEAGFPARPKRRFVWMRQLAPAGAVCGVIGALVVAAAVTGGGSGDDSGSGGDAGVAAEQAAPPSKSRADSSDSAAAAPEAAKRAKRAVQRSATMTLAARPRDIDKVAGQIGDVTAELGGYVSRSSVTSSEGGALALRIPSARLDDAIQRISKLGRVRGLSRNSEDITAQVVSARSRLADARAERKSLLKQLASATTVNETESIRARLRIVSREIEAGRAALKRVDLRADYADVSVELVARRSSGAARGSWTPGDAWHDALRLLEVIAGVLVITAAVAIPLLVAWLLGWLGRRGVTRRRRERALDMA